MPTRHRGRGVGGLVMGSSQMRLLLTSLVGFMVRGVRERILVGDK